MNQYMPVSPSNRLNSPIVPVYEEHSHTFVQDLPGETIAVKCRAGYIKSVVLNYRGAFMTLRVATHC